MKNTYQDSIRRVLTSGFTARDIAEPLIAYSADAPVEQVKNRMEVADIDAAGVRVESTITGYLLRAELATGTCAQFIHRFEPHGVISDETPLSGIVVGLHERPFLFVNILGAVGGIITRSDLEKPAVRMWLFGMITIIEQRFTRMVELEYPDNTWRTVLSAQRLARAEELQAERERRKQNPTLLDCLQFGDKFQIILKSAKIMQGLEFDSKRQAERVIKSIEKLRNNLAHSQQLVTYDWETIVMLAGNLERVIEGPPNQPNLLK